MSLPRGWVQTTLGELITLRTGPFGSSLHQADYVEGGTPLVNPMHIVGGRIVPSAAHAVSDTTLARLREFQLCKSDIVIARRGEMGRCAVVTEREAGWLCGTGSMVIRCNSAVLPEYLQLVLGTRESVDFLGQESVGSTMANLNQKILLGMPIRLPPVDEQQRIIDALDETLPSLQDAEHELGSAKRKLAGYRQSLVKAAVEGILTAEWRKQNACVEPAQVSVDRWLAKYGRRTAQPTPWSGHELLEGWAWVTVDQLTLRQRYGTSAKTSADVGGVPVLRMGNIQEGDLLFQGLKYLPENHSEFPALFARDGELLFNRTNSPELVGKCAVFRTQPRPYSFASYLIGVSLGDACVPEYVAAVINSVYGRQWVAGVVTQQVGQANVNGSKLAALTLPLPPLAEQQEIVRLLAVHLQGLTDQHEAIERGLKMAAAQRQNILRAAFAGQLVPQDPVDEPASVVIERIRAQRQTGAPTAKRKPGRPAKATA